MADYLVPNEALLGAASGKAPFTLEYNLQDLIPIFGDKSSNSRSSPSANTPGGYLLDNWRPIYVDKLIVTMLSKNFGIVVNPVERDITITSTYSVSKTLNSITLPTGFSLVGSPSFPATILPGVEYTYTVQADPTGPATVTGATITLTFADQTILILGISALRSVIMPFRPLNGIEEDLEWKTVIHSSLSGKEQRSGVRKNPRQFFTMRAETIQGLEEARLNNLLTLWQSKTIVVPVWTEPMNVTAAAAEDATTISVDDTRYADVRDGGLVAVVSGNEVVEVFEVDSHTQTSIVATGGIANAIAAGQEIFPARVCILSNSVSGIRFPVTLARTDLVFECVRNEANIGDDSAFSTLNSKAFLDEPNEISGTSPSRHFTRYATLDNGSGRKGIESIWPVGRKGFTKEWETLNRQGLWELRQLLHSLEGRRVSFYYPSFMQDFEPTEDIASASPTLNVVNTGFATYVNAASPYNRLRVVKSDGTFINRTISSVTEVDADTEELTVDSNWGETVLQADISRIELVHLSRLDTDRVRIRHLQGNGQARVSVPIVNTIT